MRRTPEVAVKITCNVEQIMFENSTYVAIVERRLISKDESE